MIESVRLYHKNRALFENFVITSDKFSQVKKTIDIKTKCIQYPISAIEPGVFVSIDEYKGYITGFPKVLFNNDNNPKRHAYSNLTYSQFKSSITSFKKFIIEPEYTRVSALKFGFSIPTNIEGTELINLNILMHNLHYYNHNTKPKKNQVLKEFVYTNYTIGVYADKVEDSRKHFIKIILHLKKSVEFRKFGIENISDLMQHKTLIALFGLLMEKFNDLIIVDSFQSFEVKDIELLQEFMIQRYWKTLAKTKSRQTTLRHRRKFQELINKYGLNTQKLSLEKELKKAFEEFVSN